jgi:hypothetical protein
MNDHLQARCPVSVPIRAAAQTGGGYQDDSLGRLELDGWNSTAGAAAAPRAGPLADTSSSLANAN